MWVHLCFGHQDGMSHNYSVVRVDSGTNQFKAGGYVLGIGSRNVLCICT